MHYFGKGCNPNAKNASNPDYECNTTTGRWNKKKARKRSVVRRSVRRRSVPRKRSVVRRSVRRRSVPRKRSVVRRSVRRRSVPRKQSVVRRSVRRRSVPRKQSVVRRSVVRRAGGGKVCNPNAKNATNPDYICNPVTGRWNKRKGDQILKRYGPNKIECRRSWEMFDPRYICDPYDGKWVLWNSPRGEKINKIGCDLPREGVDNYNIDELTERLFSCGYEGIFPPGMGRSQLYNTIDWNRINMCSNESNLLGDDVKDVPPKKNIRINGVCYDVDNVVQYLNSSRMKNVDPYNTSKQLWKNQNELENIIFHLGLDQNIKNENMIVRQKLDDELKEVVKSQDAEKIINYMFIAGWVCVSDNPFSFADEPEKFHFAQVVITNLIEMVNESENKEAWLNYSNSGGYNLSSVISNMAASCVHGIGFKLLGHANFLYYEAIKHNNFKPPDIILKTNPTTKYSETFELTSPNGLVDTITEQTPFKLIEIKGSFANRNNISITNNLKDIVKYVKKIKDSLENQI